MYHENVHRHFSEGGVTATGGVVRAMPCLAIFRRAAEGQPSPKGPKGGSEDVAQCGAKGREKALEGSSQALRISFSKAEYTPLHR